MNNLFSQVRQRLQTSVKHYKQGVNHVRYDTSDVVQESLLQLWTEMNDAGEEQFQINHSYLNRVGRGHACNLHRFHSAQRRSIRREQPGNPEMMATLRENPSQLAEQRETRDRLHQAVARLPEPLRQVFCRRFYDRQTWAQIAEELELTVDVARRRAANAIAELKALINEPQR